jgi:hypothetical protein
VISYIITYDDGGKEIVRGYNLIQALGNVTRGIDNIKFIEKT